MLVPLLCASLDTPDTSNGSVVLTLARSQLALHPRQAAYSAHRSPQAGGCSGAGGRRVRVVAFLGRRRQPRHPRQTRRPRRGGTCSAGTRVGAFLVRRLLRTRRVHCLAGRLGPGPQLGRGRLRVDLGLGLGLGLQRVGLEAGDCLGLPKRLIRLLLRNPVCPTVRCPVFGCTPIYDDYY